MATEKFTEVWNNSSAPYWPTSTTQGGGTLVIGNAQVVAMEVVVSKLLRWLLGANKSSILYLISVHSASQALLGGFSGFFDDVSYSAAEPDTITALMDGAKGIPGLFAAQYVVNTGLQGLHFPGFSFKDMLITGASKALTRPIINMAYGSLPVMLQKNFAAHDEMFNKQKTIARFKSAGN